MEGTGMASGTYSVSVRKCATCRFWDADDRRIKFVKYQATYVDCPTGNHPCLAQPGRSPRAVDHCMKWDLWEKLL